MRKVILFALIFFIPILVSAETYGSDFLTGGTASAEAPYGAPFDVENAVDNNTATRWASTNNGLPEWWKYDLGTSTTKSADKVRIYGFSDGDGGTPAQFSVQGSNDNSTWLDLSTSTITSWNTWSEFTFSNPNSYRYYRIFVSTDGRAVDDINTWWETEMMECTDCGGGSSATSTPADTAIGTFANVGLYGMITLVFISVVYFIKKI